MHGESVVRLPARDVSVLPRFRDVTRADGGVAVREAAAEFAHLELERLGFIGILFFKNILYGG